MGGERAGGSFFEVATQATSAGQAEYRLRRRYGDLQMDGLAGFREQAIGDDRFTIARICYDGGVRIAAEVDMVVFSFSTPGHGWSVGEEGGDLSACPVVFQPGQPMRSHSHGRSTVTAVSFPVEQFTSTARALYGNDASVQFTQPQAVNKTLAARWVRLVKQERIGALIRNDLSRSVVYRDLVRTALESFRAPGPEERRAATARARFEAYRRAARFIDEHMSLPINTADIASAARMSERELLGVFQGYATRMHTPELYLREARLDAAHRDLQREQPETAAAVADIARRWGFPQFNCFVDAYRRSFGQDPHDKIGR